VSSARGGTPLGLKAIPKVERAVHAAALYLAEHKELKVDQAEAHVLAHLHATRAARVGDLHEEFGHRRSTLTSVLDRLEQRALITRAIDRSDRRGITVRLTNAGSTLAAKVFDVLSKYEASALKGFSVKEIAAFQKMLEAFSRIRG
jgi:DNA-binding MarR family transcriptional regulator